VGLMGVNCFRPATEKCPVCKKQSFHVLSENIIPLGMGNMKVSEKVCYECGFYRNELELLTDKNKRSDLKC
jgi:C4-type Zn-finger protein